MWQVVRDARTAGLDPTRTLQLFDWLTPDVILAALDYYAAFPADIDQKLAEEESFELERWWKDHPETKPAWR